MRSVRLEMCSLFVSLLTPALAVGACGGASSSSGDVVHPRAAPAGALAEKLAVCARDLDGFRECAAPAVQLTILRPEGGVLRTEQLDAAHLSEGQYAETVHPLFADMLAGAAPDCGPASCTVTSESGATIRYHFDTSTPSVRLDAIALPASE